MKTLKEKMSKKNEQVITSIKMDKKLHEEMKIKLKKDGFSFHQLVEAAAKQYLEDK